MRAVFDTNILIDYLNGQAKAHEEFGRFTSRIISIITYIEVLIGATNDAEKQMIKAFLRQFQVQEINMDIADRAILVRKQNKCKLPNAVILATAICEEAVLVTRNTKDFVEDGINVRVPYQL